MFMEQMSKAGKPVTSQVDLTKSIVQRQTNMPTTSFYSPLNFTSSRASAALNNTGIPAGMKSSFEAASGFSFDDVRVHYRSAKPAQLRAFAYTQGNQVYLGAGQEKHLPHELGHVIQQKQGIVHPTRSLGGVPLNDDSSLESKADRIGCASLRYARPGVDREVTTRINTSATVQRMSWEKLLAYPRPGKFAAGTKQAVIARQQARKQDEVLPQAYRLDGEIRLLPTTHYECRSCHKLFPIEALQLGHIATWKPYVIEKVTEFLYARLCDAAKQSRSANLADISEKQIEMSIANVADKTIKEVILQAYSDIDNLDFECQTCNTSHAFEENAREADSDEPFSYGSSEDMGESLSNEIKESISLFTDKPIVKQDDYMTSALTGLFQTRESFHGIKSKFGADADAWFWDQIAAAASSIVYGNKKADVIEPRVNDILAGNLPDCDLEALMQDSCAERYIVSVTGELTRDKLLSPTRAKAVKKNIQSLFNSFFDMKYFQLSASQDAPELKASVEEARRNVILDHINNKYFADATEHPGAEYLQMILGRKQSCEEESSKSANISNAKMLYGVAYLNRLISLDVPERHRERVGEEVEVLGETVDKIAATMKESPEPRFLRKIISVLFDNANAAPAEE